MAFLAAAVFSAVFLVNVVIGAVTGSAIVGNVSEMLVLFAASISFVVGILKREAQRKAEKT